MLSPDLKYHADRSSLFHQFSLRGLFKARDYTEHLTWEAPGKPSPQLSCPSCPRNSHGRKYTVGCRKGPRQTVPWECWSMGLGGGPIPVWAPDRMPIPFIWLYRGSSGMPFSCIDSIGYEKCKDTGQSSTARDSRAKYHQEDHTEVDLRGP